MTLREQTLRLWKTCFDDEDAFVDLYFSRCYADRINRVIEEEGRVVSAFQAIPYEMTFCGETIPVAYVSGACTDPDFRGRGLMKRLLCQAHRTMYHDGVRLSTLIPAEEWLFSYYGASGYASCFRYGLMQVDKKVFNRVDKNVDNSKPILTYRKIDLSAAVDKAVYTFFDEQMRKRPCCIQHSYENLQVILADLALSGGELLAFSRKNVLVGLVFCIPSSETITIKEMLCTDEVEKEEVFAGAFREYASLSPETLSCRLPETGEMHALGMVRIVHVREVLRLFAQVFSGELHIQVTGDEAIPENNGYYSLGGGACHCGYVEGISYVSYTIRELAELIFSRSGLHPYMSLMLD